jgi:ribosome-binding protein aMBF1 (putative translation factor)
MINHGTRSGYYAHRRLSEPPCDACRTAINEYIREYRAKNGLSRNRIGEKIRRKALIVLRERHREEYDKLLGELRAEEEKGLL